MALIYGELIKTKDINSLYSLLTPINNSIDINQLIINKLN